MERLSYEFIQQLQQQPELKVDLIAYSGKRLLFPLYFALRLPSILWRARRADVVHISDPVLADIGWLIQRLHAKPIAVTVHGLDVTFDNPFFQWYQRRFFRGLDHYIAISSHAAELLAPWNVTGQTHTINPGVSDRLHDPSLQREDLDRVLGYSTTDKTILLTVGRLVKRKGHAWFITNVLPKLKSDAQYVIAGAGAEEDAIQTAAERAGVSDQVLMLGRVSEEDLRVLYNTVDAFVQPNVSVPSDAEGFGLVVTEAALCNRPVYASNIEGLTDAVHDGKNGHMLPNGDAEAWIEALETLTPIPQARQFTLQKFAWDKQAQMWTTLLQAAAKKADG